jgi:carotenoid 1,2-hydratase
VFSPYYALARGRGAANPLNHCAVNVALYGPRSHRWAMTERPRARVRRSASTLEIGPSALSWDGTVLKVDLDEVTAPLPSRIRGQVRLRPEGLNTGQIALDSDDRHRWWPIAPCSRIEVDLHQPDLKWSGPGYFDANMGDAPLEDAFSVWNWSRAKIGPDTAVLYDVSPRAGAELSVAVRFDPSGHGEAFEPPPRADLPKTGWGIRRGTRADAGHAPAVRKTLENAPFYARSLLDTQLLGQPTMAMHETLSLNRFRAGIVKAMLPFRMPRWPL